MAAMASELGHCRQCELPRTSVQMAPGLLVGISALDLIYDVLAPSSP